MWSRNPLVRSAMQCFTGNTPYSIPSHSTRSQEVRQSRNSSRGLVLVTTFRKLRRTVEREPQLGRLFAARPI